jgi:hypothetical protein
MWLLWEESSNVTMLAFTSNYGITPNKPTNQKTSWDVNQLNTNMGPIPQQQNWQ